MLRVLGPGTFSLIYGQRVVWVVVNSVNPTCAGDFDFNGPVDIGDLLLLASWGSENPALDLAPAGGDGIIDIADLLDLLSRWGEC